MKKLSVYIILSLLMCLCMVFPAFAMVYKPAYHDDISTAFNSLYTAASSKVPAGYPYYLSFSSVNVSGSVSGIALNNIVFSNTEVVDVGSKVYLYYQGSLTGPFTITSIQWLKLSIDNRLYFIAGTQTIISNLCLIVDYSTAKLPDFILNNLPEYYPYDFFVSAKLPVDISALQSLINTAKSKENIGYTATSWQALQSAITAAESLLNTADYTQSQVDAARNTIQVAINNLALRPEPPDIPKYTSGMYPVYSDYGDISSGFTTEHLSPVKDAIFANLEVSRKFGGWVYVVVMGIFVLVGLLRRWIGVSGEVSYIDMNTPSPKSSHYKSSNPPKSFKRPASRNSSV